MAVIKIGCLHNVIGLAERRNKSLHSCILIKRHISRRKTVERLAIYSHSSCQWGWEMGKGGSIWKMECRWPGQLRWVELEKLLLHCSLPNCHPLRSTPLPSDPLATKQIHTTRNIAHDQGLKGGPHDSGCFSSPEGGGNTSNHSTRHRLNTCEAIRRWGWVAFEGSSEFRGDGSVVRWRPWQITFCKIGRNCQTSQIREYANASNIHTMWLGDGSLPVRGSRGCIRDGRTSDVIRSPAWL